MSFENAAVTKGFMLWTALSSIAVGILDVKHYFHLQLVPHMSRYHQYWRLAASHLIFASSTDLLTALLLLFNVAIPVERRFGSVKFTSFIIACSLVATAIQFIALLLFHRVGFNYIPPGPLALLFCILYQYFRLVPTAYRFRVFGIPFSDKSFVYFLAFFLLTSHAPSAIIGVLTGQIYRSDLANLKSYRISPSTLRICTKYMLPLIGSTRAPRRRNRALPDLQRSALEQLLSSSSSPQNEEVVTTAPNETRNDAAEEDASTATTNNNTSVMREWVDELTGRANRANSGIRAPSDGEVSMLRSMFPDLSRDVIVGALQRSANTESAVETLLTSRT